MNIKKLYSKYEIEHNGYKILAKVGKEKITLQNVMLQKDNKFVFKLSKPEVVENMSLLFLEAVRLQKELI